MPTYNFQFAIGQRIQLPSGKQGTVRALAIFSDDLGAEHPMYQVRPGNKWWFEKVLSPHSQNPEWYAVALCDEETPAGLGDDFGLGD